MTSAAVTRSGPDVITVEVIRSALEATAREMSLIMLRAAHSPIFSDGKDYSCAIYDAQCRAVADAQDCPIHLASLQFQLATCVEELGGVEAMRPGDICVANDPYLGGSHLPDITMFQPVFYEDELVAFAANRAHHVDVGGGAPGSFLATAEEIFQEGLRIPPVRLWSRGELQEDLLALILRNVRDPRAMHGDLLAQAASIRHAAAKLCNDLMPRWGRETIAQSIDPILLASEMRMREAIEAIPDGVYEAEDFLDGDGIDPDDLRIAAKVTVAGSEVTIDLTGSAPQARGPINAPFAVSAGAAFIAMLTMTDPSIPTNAGCYRPIEVIAPPRTVVNVQAPGPCVAGNTYTALRVIDVVRRALSQALPTQSAADNGDHLQFLAGGTDPRTGEPYGFYEMPVGGWGGTAYKDGAHAMFGLNANCLVIPVEVFEARFPWRVRQMRLRPGSNGVGEHDGGLGMTKEYELVAGTARVTLASDRERRGAHGVFGGTDGAPAEQYLLRGGERIPLSSKVSNVQVSAGDVISLHTPGGGGWGAPAGPGDDA